MPMVILQKINKLRHFINYKTAFVIFQIAMRRRLDRLSEHKYVIRQKNYDYPLARPFKEKT